MNSLNPTVVLVHGALTDASVWRQVSLQLQKRGLTVVAPALAMRSFAEDVTYVRSVLDSIEGPILVAAHSYAGSVVSDPDALPGNVRGIVFVAAFQQDAGETPGGLNGKFPGSQLTPENLSFLTTTGGTEVTLRPERFTDVYAADVEPDEALIMAAAQHPFDARSLEGAFEGVPTWQTMPTWAIVSTSDVSIPTETLRFMAERAHSTITEVDSSHAVPVSHPHVVAEVIAEAANAV